MQGKNFAQKSHCYQYPNFEGILAPSATRVLLICSESFVRSLRHPRCLDILSVPNGAEAWGKKGSLLRQSIKTAV